MKLTNTIWQTLKEVPKEAEIASHQIITEGGACSQISIRDI
jgi:prolyl-tRNA synthetase